MRFHIRKKRTPSVILVSLIDILAILLIFFIVTTTFRKNPTQMQINLPESESARQVSAEKNNPIVLEIKSAAEITLDGKPVTLDGLAETLQTLRNESPKRPIAMKADREAPFGVVVTALDALKAAGIKNVPTFTQPVKKQ